MKSAYYVACVTRAYRRALDDLAAGRPFDPALMEEVEKAGSRAFTTGFYLGNPGEAGQDTSHSTIERAYDFVGVIKEALPDGWLLVEQRGKFCVGDTLETLSPGETGQFTITDIRTTGGGRTEVCAAPQGAAAYPLPAAAAAGRYAANTEKMSMQGYNVIIVYNPEHDRILMCRRRKDPYKGLSNLVGGKIEAGESGIDAAYRELNEETGVSKADIALHHVMDFTYYYQGCYVEVYAGKLKRFVAVSGDENELYWSDLNHDFFEMALYAGEGNIGHMLEQVNMYKDAILME